MLDFTFEQFSAVILSNTKEKELQTLEIFDELKFDFNCQYDEKDAIGRRYRRQDAIGTPFCITVDHQTTEDNTVTIRYRDSMEQERVHVDKLKGIIADKVDMSSFLKKLDQD